MIRTVWPVLVRFREGLIPLPLVPEIAWVIDEAARRYILFFLTKGQETKIEIPDDQPPELSPDGCRGPVARRRRRFLGYVLAAPTLVAAAELGRPAPAAAGAAASRRRRSPTCSTSTT